MRMYSSNESNAGLKTGFLEVFMQRRHTSKFSPLFLTARRSPPGENYNFTFPKKLN
jgi:hypothetical protein